jgi:hypothetical protein
VRITSLVTRHHLKEVDEKYSRHVAKSRWYMRIETLHSRRTYSRVISVRLCVVHPGTLYQGD